MPETKNDVTPMKRQYNEIKARNQDCILFFRLGDFYEMFNDDACTAARELDLTLTTRDRGKPKEEQTPMCGVPYHSAESYIARLVQRGYKVAICEQTEDPALAKGLVKREVIRVITPGTVVENTLLAENRNNYLCSIYLNELECGVCFADVSTAQVFATSFYGDNAVTKLCNELGTYAPREIILNTSAAAFPAVAAAKSLT